MSRDDAFTTDTGEALRFLGFQATEVDSTLTTGQRKVEDFHIQDEQSGCFCIGEAKTTGNGRGASEDFISKVQTHQTRYARTQKQEPPPALLIVNYAIDLDPAMRAGRFYQPALSERLSDNEISAIDSYSLFQLCQFVLEQEITCEQARKFIMRGQPRVVDLALEEVMKAISD